jgi:hypothetical protein
MLSNNQIDHFRAFGFVALGGLLGPARASSLRTEVDTALRDAYASTYEDRVIAGVSGHYLPMASALTPVSLSLICDDPVLIDAAEQLLGTSALPSVPRVSCTSARQAGTTTTASASAASSSPCI